MGKVEFNLTVSGEPQDVQATIARVFGSTSAIEPAPKEEIAWTTDSITALWEGLTDKAREVLKEMARRPEGYPFTELRQALGLDAAQVAGRLSSVGHNMRSFPGRPRLVVADGRSREYRLHPAFAEFIRSFEGS